MEGKLTIIANVLKIKRYAGVAIASGSGLGIIYYMLTMSMFLEHVKTTELLPYMITSLGLTVAISALAGINFALIIFKIKGMPSAKSGTAVLGGAFAAFTPGCPACTAPLAVVLGAVGGLSLFPLLGLELKFVSAGVLLFSVWWVARGLQSKSCCKIE